MPSEMISGTQPARWPTRSRRTSRRRGRRRKRWRRASACRLDAQSRARWPTISSRGSFSARSARYTAWRIPASSCVGAARRWLSPPASRGHPRRRSGGARRVGRRSPARGGKGVEVPKGGHRRPSVGRSTGDRPRRARAAARRRVARHPSGRGRTSSCSVVLGIVLPQCETSSDGRSAAGAKHAPSS